VRRRRRARALAVFVDQLLQIVDGKQIHVAQICDRRVDVSRHGEVDHQDGAMPPRADGSSDRALGDQRQGARRAAHDDVGCGQFLVEGGQVHGIALHLGRDVLGARQRTVGDHHALDAGACKMTRGEAIISPAPIIKAE